MFVFSLSRGEPIFRSAIRGEFGLTRGGSRLRLKLNYLLDWSECSLVFYCRIYLIIFDDLYKL